MIVAIISILAGALGLTALVDNFVGSELTSQFLGGIWSVLQFLITPIIDLFMLIWDKVQEIIRSFFFS